MGRWGASVGFNGASTRFQWGLNGISVEHQWGFHGAPWGWDVPITRTFLPSTLLLPSKQTTFSSAVGQ